MEKDSLLLRPFALILSKGAGACTVLGFILSACSQEQTFAPPVAEGTEHIACAVGGAAQLSRGCAVERVEDQGTLLLVVRHPDGAFRRFQVLTDGRGLAVADGADEAVTRLGEGTLDVTVGADRYIFPATAKQTGEAGGGADGQ
ncbi:MAG TPA: hypothetical protein VJQ77_11440 [Novosphingobium sp.]|nr:hypothetical protein [Novosphingobium sp.]